MRIVAVQHDERTARPRRASASLNALPTSHFETSPINAARSAVGHVPPTAAMVYPRKSATLHSHITIIDLLAQRNQAEDNIFVIHRKLLRRRHVRKEQMRRQREAAKNHRHALLQNATIPNSSYSAVISIGALSEIDTTGSTIIHSADRSQSHTEHSNARAVDDNRNQNYCLDFVPTPLPFSPVKVKRRKLEILSK